MQKEFCPECQVETTAKVEDDLKRYCDRCGTEVHYHRVCRSCKVPLNYGKTIIKHYCDYCGIEMPSELNVRVQLSAKASEEAAERGQPPRNRFVPLQLCDQGGHAAFGDHICIGCLIALLQQVRGKTA